MKTQMNCRDCKQHLSACLDGELELRLHRQVVEHVAACPECRQYQARLERAYALLQPGEALPPDPLMAVRVRDALRRSLDAGAQRFRITFRLLIPVSVAAGILLGVLLGQNLSTRWSATTPVNQETLEAALIPQAPGAPLTSNYLDLSWPEGGKQ